MCTHMVRGEWEGRLHGMDLYLNVSDVLVCSCVSVCFFMSVCVYLCVCLFADVWFM